VAVNPYNAPRTNKIIDDLGNITTEWQSFFTALSYSQGPAITTLASTAALSDVIAAVNQVLAALRDQNRISK
jgi:hypothetical protein